MRTLFLTLITCLFALPAHAKYNGGTGEPNDPYQIATAEDLMLLGDSPSDYDKHFILTADIDLDPNLPGRKVFDKAVIGQVSPSGGSRVWQGTPFTGVLDGNGHTISHLTILGAHYLGLLGGLGSGAEVRDLGVVDVNVTGSGSYVGGLVGYNGGGAASPRATAPVLSAAKEMSVASWGTTIYIHCHRADHHQHPYPTVSGTSRPHARPQVPWVQVRPPPKCRRAPHSWKLAGTSSARRPTAPTISGGSTKGRTIPDSGGSRFRRTDLCRFSLASCRCTSSDAYRYCALSIVTFVYLLKSFYRFKPVTKPSGYK